MDDALTATLPGADGAPTGQLDDERLAPRMLAAREYSNAWVDDEGDEFDEEAEWQACWEAEHREYIAHCDKQDRRLAARLAPRVVGYGRGSARDSSSACAPPRVVRPARAARRLRTRPRPRF